VLQAAIFWLNLWVTFGHPPPVAPRLELTSVSPVVFARDADGNALGGARSPQVDAPVAALTGADNTGSGPIGMFCRLFGTTVPFDATRLAALYPSHGTFVFRSFLAALNEVHHGYLLVPDAVELVRAAASSQIGS
jgi:hypothetical protein